VQQVIESTGKFGDRTQARENLNILSTLNKEDLGQLIEQGKPLTRVYSFWEFVRRDSSDYRRYFSYLIYDQRKIENAAGNGCKVPPPSSVGHLSFDIAEDRRGFYGTRNIYPYFLDSISIAMDIRRNWDIRGNVNIRLMNIRSQPELYDRLRDKAANGSIAATIGLSGYNNAKDTLIIRQMLDPRSSKLLYGLMCVQKFPHSAFESDISSVFDHKMKQQYPLGFGFVCELLLQYESKSVSESFDRLLSNPDQYYYHIIQLWVWLQRPDNENEQLSKQLVKVVGRRELKRRVEEYRNMNYWSIANKANQN
jgi:hypothetical protein